MCELHQQTGPSLAVRPLTGMHRRDVVRALWAGTMLLGVAGCETVSEAFAPSDEELLQASAQAWTETKQQTPISKDAKANKRLQTVGPKIALAAGRPNDPWEYVVFDSAEKNAWVLPGGKVGFYKGLMDFCDNDDMVAAVLGHETGHVIARHAALRAGQQTATNLAIQGGGAILGSTVKLSSQSLELAMAAAGAGAQVGIFLPFSRENELQADSLGVDYMHSAGYDVKQAIRLWEKMDAASGARQSEWMSTHPNPGTRIEALKKHINEMGYAKV